MNRPWIPMLLVAAFSPSLPAQEEADPESAWKAKAAGMLTDALLHYKQADHLVARVEIEHKAPERPAMGGAAVIVRQFGPGPDGNPFEGEVEAWRDAGSEICIISKREYPGFEMFVGLDRTVRQITYEDKRPSLARLERELSSILDGERFVRFVRNADLQPALDEETGEATFEGKLSKKLIPGVAGADLPRLLMAEKILRIEARFVVTARGRFKEATLRVVRSAPGGGALHRRVVIGPDGKPQVQEGEKDEEVESGSTVYALSFGAAAPSERARAFKRDAKRLLEKSGGG